MASTMTVVLGALMAMGAAGCTRQRTEEVTPACTGDTARLRGVVVDEKTSAPLPGALLAVEAVEASGGASGGASYRYGMQADADGRFDGVFPCGTVNVHAFASGHRCGEASTEVGDVVRVLAPALSDQDVAPTLSNASLQPSEVAPGEPVTVHVTATAGSRVDPLPSDGVVAIAPELAKSFALDAPALPQGSLGGEWTGSFAAPSAPGTYAVQLVAASQLCVPSAPTVLTLTVH